MGKKFLAAVLALAMLAGVVPAFAVSETKKVGDDLVYTNDFSYSVEEMLEDPYLNWTWRDDKWAIEDGQLSTIGKQVTAFGFNSVLGKYGTHYEMETDFAVTEEEGADEIQHAFMVGTRVVGETNLHIDSGLWFMVKERQINVIVAKHAAEESVKVDVPFSFKTMRKIYVEDSQKEIKFYADNDNKEKTLLCTVSLTTDAINVADGSGAAKGSLKRYDVPDYGYVRFMAHYAAGKVDNLKVTYEPVDWSGISFDAFSPIEVGNAYSVNETGSAGVTWRMEDDSVVCFKSVDFGEGASYMGFNLSGGYNGCYGSVYIDSPDGEQVLDKAWLLANQYDGSWHEEIFPIKPVSGKHDIYLKIDKVVAARHSPQLSFIRFYKDQPEAYKGDESLEYADLSAPGARFVCRHLGGGG